MHAKKEGYAELMMRAESEVQLRAFFTRVLFGAFEQRCHFRAREPPVLYLILDVR